MMRNYSQLFLYVLIIIFWISLIAAWLWSPLIINAIKTRKSITVFLPALTIDPQVIKKFETETGITTYITYYENPGALLSKLAASKGHGYDLIFADDHSMEQLVHKNMLATIDATKFSFFKNLDPLIAQNNYYDTQLLYTLPYYSTLYGIIYNKQFFADAGLQSPQDWSLLFNPPPLLRGRVCMTDDPREAFLLASLYKYGSPEALKQVSSQQEIVALLRAQKKSVDVYSIERADVLMQTESCLIGVLVSSDAWRLQKKSKKIGYVIPAQGTFIGIYSFAIIATSAKQHYATQLLEFLFKPEIMKHHQLSYGYNVNSTVVEKAPDIVSIHDFKEMPIHFFANVISDPVLNQLWIKVLS